MSENAIQLTYLDVRGRCEPVYLLLEDSNVKYINKIITWEEWEDLKDLNLNGPPQFPYYALPVLSIPGSNLKGGKSCVFAETSAILAFLDEYLPENYELVSRYILCSAVSFLSLYITICFSAPARNSNAYADD